MHSTSLYAGYPRSPFKFPAFINALLFLCHTSGSKLFPGCSVLLRPSSNPGLYSRYLLQPSTNAGPLPNSNARMYPSSNAGLCSELQRRTVSELQRQTISEVSYHLGSKKFEGVYPSFMPDCFRGGAPPRMWADFCEYFLLVQFILCRDISQ